MSEKRLEGRPRRPSFLTHLVGLIERRRDRAGVNSVAYDEATADRIRRLLAGRADVVEKRLGGGGLGFMVDGNLCCGVSSRGLTVRVGPEAKADAVAKPYVSPLAFGGRETAAFFVVEPAGYASPASLEEWVEEGLRYVDTLE